MKLTGYQIFRLTCITLLWVLACVLVVGSQPLTPMVVFTVVASGIIVFVPLYKRYIKEKKDE